MNPSTSPCTWPVSYAGCSLDSEGLPTCFADVEQQALFEQIATEYLWQWTYRRYGLCDLIVRPCKENCYEGRSSFYGSGPSAYLNTASWRPVLISGLWYNVGCGLCGDKCSCGQVSSITLPGPIDSIIAVTIDGEVVPATGYRVDNFTSLVSEGNPWPVCQNMGLPPGEVGTWTIEYRRGIEVPLGGQIAAGVLACELAKAACRDKSCQLPQRVQTITREGVTIAMLDAFDDVEKGHTGIWIIDSWLSSVTKPMLPSTVRSPDFKGSKMRRTTWTAP